MPSLAYVFDRWRSTVRTLRYSIAAICSLLRPRATSSSTCSSRVLSSPASSRTGCGSGAPRNAWSSSTNVPQAGSPPGRLALEQHVVPALERRELRAGDERRHQASLVEWDERVVARVHDERRYADLRSEACHVEPVAGGAKPDGDVRGGRDACELVEPLELLGGPARKEQHGERPPERDVPRSPSDADQRLEELGLLALRGVPEGAAAGVSAVEDETAHAVGVAYRVGDRDCRPLRDPEQGEPVDAGGVHNGLEVRHRALEREVGHLAV